MFKLVIINDNYLHVILYDKFRDALVKFYSLNQNAYLEIHSILGNEIWFPKKKFAKCDRFEKYLEIISNEYNKAGDNELFWCRKMSQNKLLDVFIHNTVPRNLFDVNDIYIDKILSDKEFRMTYLEK